MVIEIQAKSLLSAAKTADWFGARYIYNIYRGCTHGCIYCDSRSRCYGIDDFENVRVKVNALELLRAQLARKHERALIATGSASDPYNPAEEQYRLTRETLALCVQMGFPVHICTKSDMILRDADLFVKNPDYYSAAFTVTTCDEALAARLEPGAPSPQYRLRAMRTLSDLGMCTGVMLSPVLPFIEDTEKNIRAVIAQSAENGARYCVAFFGVTLRDRQREYFFRAIERHYPNMSGKYLSSFGVRDTCMSKNAQALDAFAADLCKKHGMAYGMKAAAIELRGGNQQTSFFDAPGAGFR